MENATGRTRTSKIVHALRGRPGHWHTACGAGDVSTMTRRSSAFTATGEPVTCKRCAARSEAAVADAAEPVALGPCRYFALCENDATGVVSNPIVGDVPTCARCAAKVGADLRTFDKELLRLRTDRAARG